MSTWKTRGLRGSAFEDLINRSNEYYREKNLALIQKIPTPITPIEMDKASRHITLAYFEQKSTVDYIGAVQGIPVCFDAKECQTENFPLHNINAHQIAFMRDFEAQKGIAFLLISYTHLDLVYYMRFTEMMKFVNRAEEGGLKHFKRSELSEEFYLPRKKGIFVPFLDGIQKDLQFRD